MPPPDAGALAEAAPVIAIACPRLPIESEMVEMLRRLVGERLSQGRGEGQWRARHPGLSRHSPQNGDPGPHSPHLCAPPLLPLSPAKPRGCYPPTPPLS